MRYFPWKNRSNLLLQGLQYLFEVRDITADFQKENCLFLRDFDDEIF